MRPSLSSLVLSSAIAVCGSGCDVQKPLDEGVQAGSKNLQKVNQFGDPLCLVTLKTGKQVEKLCHPKPPKIERYSKNVGGGFGVHPGGFGWTPQEGHKVYQPGIGNIPYRQVTCVKTTYYGEDGNIDRVVENCN